MKSKQDYLDGNTIARNWTDFEEDLNDKYQIGS